MAKWIFTREREKKLKQFNNLCWICGNIADSREHKFKASLLKKHFGKKYGFKNPHVYVQGNKQIDIETYKSKQLKFKKTICINCNNNTTKAHDDAFDIFCEFVRLNYRELIEIKAIDFESVYGNRWEE